MSTKSHRFEPIAIVGQSCVLPGALDPESLWRQIHAGCDLLTDASAGHWRLDSLERVLADPGAPDDLVDRVATLRSGVVSGFPEAFAQGLAGADDPQELAGLDSVFQWLLYCGREALRDAGFARGDLRERPELRGGAIVGNLSYPTAGLNEFYEKIAFEEAGAPGRSASASMGVGASPQNRFMSGLPAHWLAQRLGCRAGAFALDAACASAIFALKLACDRLQSGQADLMLAGAINAADDLFLHVGFTALQALSPSGRSRPFHREADGLVPSQGAALFVLKTLERARRDGDHILGVIRGIGLSNDGRSRGFLAPAESGQVAAMRSAYAAAGLRPADISFIECHATGTAVGDGTEIRSMREIFQKTEGCVDIPIGSLKSNLGHLITASGAAGLIKILKAFEHDTLPGTLHVAPDAALPDLNGSSFRVVTGNESYRPEHLPDTAPRRAAVSSFGFGGNNGHLIVEEWTPEQDGAAVFAVRANGKSAAAGKKLTSNETHDAIAVVAMGARVGELEGIAALREALFERRSPAGKSADDVALDLKSLPFPPRDLESALGQQLLMLQVCDEALEGLQSPLDAERTGVFVGMQCDTEIARYSLRWRLAGLLASRGLDSYADTKQARDAVVPPLDAAGVIGRMPNIPANRLNAWHDFRGPGFTVSAEELSGIRALEIAVEALRRHEIDAALVGAVDQSRSPAHEAAARALGTMAASEEPGDAALVFVCKRLTDAQAAGDEIYALLEPENRRVSENADVAAGADRPAAAGPSFRVAELCGYAHAAAGLLELAGAVLAARHGVRPGDTTGGPDSDSHAMPDPGSPGETRRYVFEGLGGATARVAVTAPAARAAYSAGVGAGIQLYCGSDAQDLLQRLESGAPAEVPAEFRDSAHRARLALIANRGQEREQRDRAIAALRARAEGGASPAKGPSPDEIAPGVFFRERPMDGELAFAFTGAASAYPGMGRELLLAYPELHEGLARQFSFQNIGHYVGRARGRASEQDADAPLPLAFEQLCGSSYLCQIHARLSRNILGLRPDAVLGLSSGETNSLLAMGVWSGMEHFLGEIERSGMYDRELAGEFAAVARYRAKHGLPGKGWSDWRLLAPVDAVRKSIAREPGVRLTIINADEDCVIGGAPDACARVIAEIGDDLAIPLGHGMAVHCPEVGDFADAWYRLHHRETRPPASDVRFYSNHYETAYVPDAERVAEALTANALNTIDFPRIIERAYADGVRIFVEHGPRGLLGKWIARILGDREYCAVSFDAPGASLPRTHEAVARLLVCGVAMDYSRFAIQSGPALILSGNTFMKSFDAHPAPLRISSGAQRVEASAQHMQPAPELAPVGIAANASNLESASGESNGAAPAVSSVASMTAVPHNIAQVPGVANSRSGDGPAAIYLAFAEQMRDLTVHHRSFLDQQRTLHEDFLRLNHQLISGLRGAQTQIPGGGFVNRNNPPRESISNDRSGNSSPTRPDDRPDVSGAAPAPAGLSFSREQLEIHAGGRISEIFGELFERQDDFARQVRMPEPPLLLADRVTNLQAEAGSMGTGTVWTETDVRRDAWYLNAGRMPAGVMIESGQADLFLISYLGVDFHNRGERVYRLLGCELTYRGRLPAVGETLRYDIHVDGHAAQGDIRLFFFHYDCRVGDDLRLSVRNGQAGFFTDEELADSGGILWDPESGEYDAQARLDPPAIDCERRAFSNAELGAFSEGDVFACFGPGFEYAQTHVRSPKIQSGRMLFLDEVTEFDPRGGPWGRGYLRARSELSPDDWFFAGHFKNDPCMPGTLMFEGCLQAMAVYLSGLGYSVSRDGWLFEPVPDLSYKLMCRGQATPESREIIYEVFVEEVHDGPMPTLFADLLCTIDGRKAFHARRMGLRLVPDWPLTSRPELLENFQDPVPVAQAGGLPLGYASLLACAWGPPSDAFGEMYRRFDGPRTVPRLPGPPYHFMSRVTKLTGEIGELREGARVEIEYDVPDSSEWYYQDGSDSRATVAMPFAVLLEAALQPCGWLASYVGSTLTTDDALFFRNLDGSAKLTAEVEPAAGVFRTAVELTSISQTGPMIIQSFDVRCYLNDREIYEMQTVFGFFPAEALANQVGLAVDDSERERCFAPSNFALNLSDRPERYFGRALHLPDSMLCMLDRVTGFWPATDAETSPVARLRGEKDVEASEWFFKAHFFQDPVQPGSLGLEALLQLLQFFMIHEELDAGVECPRFEVIQLNEPIAWKYRGQVVPKNKLITSELEVLEVGRDERGPFARAQGWLWVDGKRIYHFADFGLRIVTDPGGPGRGPLKRRREQADEDRAAEPDQTSYESRSRSEPTVSSPGNEMRSPETEGSVANESDDENGVEILDPRKDRWLVDHCPTYTIPVLPMMSVFDRLAGAVLEEGADESRGSPECEAQLNMPARFQDLVLGRWISFAAEARKLRVESSATAEHDEYTVRLSLWREAGDPRFSRFDEAATMRARALDAKSDPRPKPLTALDPALSRELPYVRGAMFHGPAFQLLRELREDPSARSASGILEAHAGADGAPRGSLHQTLLDAGTHIIPADRLHEWAPAEIGADQVAYPARIIRADVFESLPDAGPVRIEARMLDAIEFAETPGLRFPVFRLQWLLSASSATVNDETRVAIEMDLAYALFPKGPLGAAAPERRRAFLRDAEYAEGMSLSSYDESSGESRASDADLRASDWLEGTVNAVYRCEAVSGDARLVEIAAKDHLARLVEIHPGQIRYDADRRIAFAERMPCNPITIETRLSRADGELRAIVRGGDGEFPGLDADLSRDVWREMLGTGPWPGESLVFGLIQKFVRRFVVEDPRDFAGLRGRPVLYLANHQVGIESVLFAILAGAYSGVPLKTIAKIQHSESYIGHLIDCFMSYPGVRPPESIIYFDEDRPETFLDHLADFRRDTRARAASLMVHAEGARAYSARHEVRILSQVLVDFAIEMNFPIVPVWFAGGLPVATQTERIEFPCGYGSQDYHLGRSIAPDELSGLPGPERVRRVLEAINATGPAPERERPNPPDAFFAERVAALQVEAHIGEVAAVMRVMLESLVDSGPEIRHILSVLSREDATPAALEAPQFAGDVGRLEWMRKLAAFLTAV